MFGFGSENRTTDRKEKGGNLKLLREALLGCYYCLIGTFLLRIPKLGRIQALKLRNFDVVGCALILGKNSKLVFMHSQNYHFRCSVFSILS